jgi:hypothetical protein
LSIFPPGSSDRVAIIEVFLRRLEAKPNLIPRLHPATIPFHRELVIEIMAHPKLTPELRSCLLANHEITATIL